MFRISKDSPVYYLTSVANNRLPIFRTEKLKLGYSLFLSENCFEELVMYRFNQSRTAKHSKPLSRSPNPDRRETAAGCGDFRGLSANDHRGPRGLDDARSRDS